MNALDIEFFSCKVAINENLQSARVLFWRKVHAVRESWLYFV